MATTERMGVDPLAVMDELIVFGSRGVERDDPAREMLEAAHEARAAVAELVAAAKAYQAVSGVAPTFGEVRDARKRLFAALAPFSDAGR